LRVEDLAQAFRDFTAAGKKTRNAALVEGMARTLPYGAGNADFFALIKADSGASILEGRRRAGAAPSAQQLRSVLAVGLPPP
jgi:hypothetical protein